MDDLQQLAYAAGHTRRKPIPAPPYEGIRLGTLLIRFLAWMCFAVASGLLILPFAPTVVSSIIHGLGLETTRFAIGGLALFVVLLPLAVFLLCIWALLLMIAELALAIRDMAINTFRMLP